MGSSQKGVFGSARATRGTQEVTGDADQVNAWAKRNGEKVPEGAEWTAEVSGGGGVQATNDDAKGARPGQLGKWAKATLDDVQGRRR
jgi:hypothetical protein